MERECEDPHIQSLISALSKPFQWDAGLPEIAPDYHAHKRSTLEIVKLPREEIP
jgi:hypothetical protein